MEAGQTAAVHRILSSEPFLAETSELFRIKANISDVYVGKLETCWCNESTWAKGGSFKRRRDELVKLTGSAQCVWKGRMGPWWVAAGRAIMRDELSR